MSYAREKLREAGHSLAVSSASIQKRLEFAILDCGAVKPNSFPTDCPEGWEEWQEIEHRCLRGGSRPPENGLLKDTLSQMGDEEAEEIARLIWSLLWKLEAHEQETRRNQSIQTALSRVEEAAH